MSFTLNRVRKGLFLDSVFLMQVSRSVAAFPGVQEAALMMGTPANQRILDDSDLLGLDGKEAEGGDLIIAVKANDKTSARKAMEEAALLLTSPGSSHGAIDAIKPRTLRSALQINPTANFALISVPGDFASNEARKALRAGLNVMIFSDNVPLDEEISIKHEARERKLLVMGPDCGTALIAGKPLGFANELPTGDIGIIGASGTGIQEVSCLIAKGGGGISHAIGVGGRDLSKEVGGMSTVTAIQWLKLDAKTRNVSGVRTLRAAAADALGSEESIFGQFVLARKVDPNRKWIRGLFSGGSLAAEAQMVLCHRGLKVMSNAPIPGVNMFSEGIPGHILLDLGEDQFTRGRPHPMIDPVVREKFLRKALDDDEIGVILLDVVIGFGSSDDPASHIVRALDNHQGRDPIVVASVTGTEDDRQVLSRQVAILKSAGVSVAPSNAHAAEAALAYISS